jgi:hypothetical protein
LEVTISISDIAEIQSTGISIRTCLITVHTTSTSNTTIIGTRIVIITKDITILNIVTGTGSGITRVGGTRIVVVTDDWNVVTYTTGTIVKRTFVAVITVFEAEGTFTVTGVTHSDSTGVVYVTDNWDEVTDAIGTHTAVTGGTDTVDGTFTPLGRTACVYGTGATVVAGDWSVYTTNGGCAGITGTFIMVITIHSGIDTCASGRDT